MRCQAIVWHLGIPGVWSANGKLARVQPNFRIAGNTTAILGMGTPARLPGRLTKSGSSVIAGAVIYREDSQSWFCRSSAEWGAEIRGERALLLWSRGVFFGQRTFAYASISFFQRFTASSSPNRLKGTYIVMLRISSLVLVCLLAVSAIAQDASPSVDELQHNPWKLMYLSLRQAYKTLQLNKMSLTFGPDQ